MALIEQIEQDLITALKEKDEATVSTLRMLKSALKNKEIALKAPLKEEDILTVIQSQIKSRQDSAELYKQGNRLELAEKEKQEIEILRSYLPAQMGEDEIRTKIAAIIQEVSAKDIKDMGKVMGRAASELKGKADMSEVSRIVKESLE